MIVTAFATALGFAVVGTQHQPLLVLLAYAATCCLWTPMVPLTDAYALRGVARYGLNYGPLRLWGSAAFVVGALACGLLVDVIAARHLIWVIAVGGRARRARQPRAAAAGPSESRLRPPCSGASALAARSRLSRHHRRVGADPGQPRRLLHLRLHHLAGAGFGGLTIAGLWVLGVLAEIVVFALSPRFTLPPAVLVVIGGAERGGALGDHGAGAVGRGAVGGPTGARADLRADPGRHHGTDGASRARST